MRHWQGLRELEESRLVQRRLFPVTADERHHPAIPFDRKQEPAAHRGRVVHDEQRLPRARAGRLFIDARRVGHVSLYMLLGRWWKAKRGEVTRRLRSSTARVDNEVRGDLLARHGSS